MKKRKTGILLLIALIAVPAVCAVIAAIRLQSESGKPSDEAGTEENFIKDELRQEISGDTVQDTEGNRPENSTEAEESAVRERDPESIKAHLSGYSNDYEELLYSEAYVVVHGKEEWGTGYLADFLEKVEQKKSAEMDIIQFTTEGDAIVYYLNYNGGDFYLVQDFSRDAFKGNGPSYEEWTFPYLKIFEVTGENGEKYREFYLTEDDSATLDEINAYDFGEEEDLKYLYLMTVEDFAENDGMNGEVQP